MDPFRTRDLRVGRGADLALVAHIQNERDVIVLPQPPQICLVRVEQARRAQQQPAADMPPVLELDPAELAGVFERKRQLRQLPVSLQHLLRGKIHLDHKYLFSLSRSY